MLNNTIVQVVEMTTPISTAVPFFLAIILGTLVLGMYQEFRAK